jgi:hypothetical protein
MPKKTWSALEQFDHYVTVMHRTGEVKKANSSMKLERRANPRQESSASSLSATKKPIFSFQSLASRRIGK